MRTAGMTCLMWALIALPVFAQQFRPNNGAGLRSYRSNYSAAQLGSTGGERLDVATYNLTPREPMSENVEQVRAMADSTITVVKTILYAQGGEKAAAEQGRKLWYDPNTLQVTITDYPSNLRRVSDFMKSVTAGGKSTKSEITYLKHQSAADMQDLVGRAMGTSAGSATSGSGQESVSRTLRVEGELTFRDMRIRITRVNENDVNDDNDDSVEMVIRTPTNSEDRTIEEFRSEFVDQYEINVIEVRPSGNNNGSVRLEVRLAATATGVAPPLQ